MYLFDNTCAQVAGRSTALETSYDPISRRQLELTGLAEGWRCLEVGGAAVRWAPGSGNGSAQTAR